MACVYPRRNGGSGTSGAQPALGRPDPVLPSDPYPQKSSYRTRTIANRPIFGTPTKDRYGVSSTLLTES